jgi:Tol biopolymer transport system component
MTRILAGLIFLGATGAALAQQCEAVYARTITTLRENAARVDWSRANDLIIYDRAPLPTPEVQNPYFDVYVLRNDRPDECLTCGKDIAGLRKNKGNPAWHPSGNYIVFQAETDESTAEAKLSNPGRGVNNVLWLTNPSGTAFWQLTLPSASALGVLHPHFSEDGQWLSWSEMVERGNPVVPGKLAGYWRLMTAKLDTSGAAPRLVDIKPQQPAMPQGFYENHGFSPDGGKLIFSSNAARSGLLGRINNDIFTLDLKTNALTQLTRTDYNEHAGYFPSGAKILWMSSRNVPGQGTDLWIMNPDGSGEQRLTYLNDRRCPEYVPERVIMADSSVNARGDRIVAFAQRGLLGDYGSILLIELASPF